MLRCWCARVVTSAFVTGPLSRQDKRSCCAAGACALALRRARGFLKGFGACSILSRAVH